MSAMEFTTIKTLSGVMKTGIREIVTKKSVFLRGKFQTFIYFFNDTSPQSALLSVILTQSSTPFRLSCQRYRSRVYSEPTVLYLYSILPPNYDTINLVSFPMSFQISSLYTSFTSPDSAREAAYGKDFRLCAREDERIDKNIKN